MDTPKVTVYIPSHNYGAFLQEAIESVLRQTYSSWELLIINDSSTDNTPEVMEYYKGDERIRLFHTSYGSLPKVCNLAIREARGEYIIRLDGDDVFGSNILLVLATHLDQNPDCALVFPDYYLVDETGGIVAHEWREKFFQSNHVFDNPPNGACCLIRRTVLEEVHCYREDLGAQDGYDLWNKLRKSHRVSNVNLPLFFYRRHDSSLTTDSRRILAARRHIKLDAVAETLNTYRPLVLCIPCRQNYDFVPNLWNRPLCGKTLLEREIEKALRSKLFDTIAVCCDNPGAREVMERYADPRLFFHARRREDTIRSASLALTLDSLFSRIDPDRRGTTVISYPQAPFVSLESLEEALTTLVINDADAALGMIEVDEPLFKRGAHGLVRINPFRGVRSDFDAIYQQVNTARALKNRNVDKGALDGPLVVHFPMQRDEFFFINSAQNLRVAEALLRDSPPAGKYS